MAGGKEFQVDTNPYEKVSSEALWERGLRLMYNVRQTHKNELPDISPTFTRCPDRLM